MLSKSNITTKTKYIKQLKSNNYFASEGKNITIQINFESGRVENISIKSNQCPLEVATRFCAEFGVSE